MNCVVCFILISLIQGLQTKTTIYKNYKVNRLEVMMEDQGRRMEAMETIIQNQAKFMESMEAFKQNQEKHMNSLEKIIADQQNEIKELQRQRTSGIETGIPRSQRETPQRSAFYAYLSRNELNPDIRHSMIFDKVITNVNNAYNQYTGVFSVPSSGTYVFTFSLRLYHNYYGAFEIIKNNEVVGTFMHEHDNAPEQDTVTGIVVITVNQGDVVYLRTHSTLRGHGDINSDSTGRSSFSGWEV